jgi:hypothetical protein
VRIGLLSAGSPILRCGDSDCSQSSSSMLLDLNLSSGGLNVAHEGMAIMRKMGIMKVLHGGNSFGNLRVDGGRDIPETAGL